MLLIQNAHVFAPEDLGKLDILIAAGKVIYMAPKIDSHPAVETVLDASGKYLTPGIIDQHVHITGAGGKHGFYSMTPEFTAIDFVSCGTTTVVGLMGTDGVARSIRTLYAKANALDSEGITAYMYTGYYGLDPVHIMADVQEEMVFIDKVLGCKIAIADIRSSYPTDLDLVRILRQIRVGGMLAGKKGILHVHLGALTSGMDPLFRIVKDYEFPIAHISPTHVGRTKDLFEQAIDFAKLGGIIDITTGASKYTAPYLSVLYALEKQVPIEKMTFSSDGNAGLDKKDEEGKLIGIRRAPITENLHQTLLLIKEGNVAPSDAFKIVTTNPATNLGLMQKGRVATYADADFCLFDDSWTLQDVIARGKPVMVDGEVTLKPTFHDN